MTTIVVAAAVVEHESRFLITQRQRGTHLEGFWEFPGGKCEPGESHSDCLSRELREELGVAARIGPEILATTHAYADRCVELHFLRCELLGPPIPQIGQRMRWAARDELRALRFPPADVALIERLTRDEG